MTFAECEILADAACHLKALAERLSDRRDLRELNYVLGMLATLPLTTEGDLSPAWKAAAQTASRWVDQVRCSARV